MNHLSAGLNVVPVHGKHRHVVRNSILQSLDLHVAELGLPRQRINHLARLNLVERRALGVDDIVVVHPLVGHGIPGNSEAVRAGQGCHLFDAVRRVVHVDEDPLVRVNALRQIAAIVDLNVGVVPTGTNSERVGLECKRLVGIHSGNQTTAHIESVVALSILVHEEADNRLVALVLVKVGPVDVELVRDHCAVACAGFTGDSAEHLRDRVGRCQLDQGAAERVRIADHHFVGAFLDILQQVVRLLGCCVDGSRAFGADLVAERHRAIVNIQFRTVWGDQHQVDVIRFLLVANTEDRVVQILCNLNGLDDRPLFPDVATPRLGDVLVEDIPVVVEDGVGVFLRHLDDGHEGVLPRFASEVLGVHLGQAASVFSGTKAGFRMVLDVELGPRPRVVNRWGAYTRGANALGVPVPLAPPPAAVEIRPAQSDTRLGDANLRHLGDDLKINSGSYLPVFVGDRHVDVGTAKVNSSDNRNGSWDLNRHAEVPVEVTGAGVELHRPS